ncbi:response regulator [Aeromicrobium terrae]|uniref:response regulator n=1 Tax=Aeromicrobium terrae TaxID=2498846 RepID=UPI001C9C079A|nr:response regulator transcription factor [Aeromicrobium terrae]
MSIRVAVVDDDAMVRAALTMMLDGADDIRVVAEAADGADVPAALDAHTADIVLMDLRMPQVDGITATRRIRERPNPPEVVVLTTFDADDDVISALQAGAAGYLLKDTPPDRLVAALRQVSDGEPILSPQITRRLMDATATSATSRQEARATLAGLTDRESEVVLAVARGRSNAEIAGELFMSVATVKAHVSSILAKLGMTNRTQLALLVHDAGVL